MIPHIGPEMVRALLGRDEYREPWLRAEMESPAPSTEQGETPAPTKSRRSWIFATGVATLIARWCGFI